MTSFTIINSLHSSFRNTIVFVYKFSAHLMAHTPLFHFRNRTITAVWRNSQCALWESRNNVSSVRKNRVTTQKLQFMSSVQG